ncbi:PepSY domain-containing protein [Litoribrevibacter albus]|uniref:PepSY domain-containing protein n=1 Tax=Litoribrevibacter albus TaxID=1473156 RepID=A0AA37SCW1_9GAMM|nr:PepSY domain-containing protein [Litoribrevibacter albus]GLQ32027.1 hypothetical protein GCM10007876_25060 [Litoribrevibacter albus]
MNMLMKKVSVYAVSVSTMLGFIAVSTPVSADGEAELLQMKRTPVSVEPALIAINDAFPGLIYELELDEHRGQLVYDAEVVNLKDGTLYEVMYRPVSGNVELKETENISLLGFNRFNKAELHALELMEQHKYSLIDQLAKVKANYPGAIREVELESDKGVSYYKIKLISPEGVRRKVILDTENGEMIPVMDHD